MKHGTRYILYKISDDKSRIHIEEVGGKEKSYGDFRKVE